MQKTANVFYKMRKWNNICTGECECFIDVNSNGTVEVLIAVYYEDTVNWY